MIYNTGHIANINKTFILDAIPNTATTTTLSACTTMFTNLVESCSGNTFISLGTDLITLSNNLNVNGWITGNTFSAITINANSFYSGSTNLLDIINTNDTFLTGATFSNNTLSLKRNDDVTISLLINNFSGLTVNGNSLITGNTNISGNTSIQGDIISGGTNLLNIFALAGSDTNTYVTGGTFNNNTITLTRNDNVNINISGITDNYTTGVTFNNNILYFDRNDSLSAYTVNLSSLAILDVYTTGVTFNNNILTTTNNTGGTINTLINNLTGLTVNGSLSANTIYGDGSNITGINFNQLATTAHTHQISDVINLQTSLNNKFDKSGGTISGDVFINGNVSILGTATTINTTTLSVQDNIITLNSNVTGGTETPVLNAGLEVMRGSATTKTFQWDESNKRWSLDDNTIINGNLITTGTTNISGTTSIGGDIISGGTNLSTIFKSINSLDVYTTGTTFNNNILTLGRNDNVSLSVLINNLSGLTINGNEIINGNLITTGTTNFSGTSSFGSDIISGGTDLNNIFKPLNAIDVYVTGGTYSNNTFTFTNNTGGTFNTNFDTVSGLTVNGNTLITGNTNISGNTSINGNIVSGGTNLLNIFALAGSDTNTYVTGGTFNNDTITLTRNDNVNINITGITDYYTTGATFNNNILYFDRNDSLSAYTVNLSSLAILDVYTTGVTFNNNILTTTNNTGGTINTLINNLTGLTVNGSLSANTIYGDGSNITGINFNQLATTAHTHHISDIINLQSSLNNKFDKSGGTISGDVFINGNVSILGTATTINTTTLSVEDNIITLNSNVTGATQTPLLNAGFEVMRGSATTKTFQWDESNKRWSLDDNTIINGNLITTGTTNISGTTSIGGDIISGGTNLLTLFKPLNATDVYITGGTYSNGTSTFTNNTGGTFNVTGYYTGATDIYTTGATLNGNTLSFNRNDVLSAYTVNLTPIISNLWTGGTGAGSVVLSGSNSVASGKLSVAEGSGTTASGVYSHTEGYKTTASGEQSHAEGYSTQATGWSTHSEGESSQAIGYTSHAEGLGSAAVGNYSHSEGSSTYTSGEASHAEGFQTTASNVGSHSEGRSTRASGYASHAEGGWSTSSGAYSHSEGFYSTSVGDYSHAEGSLSTASGEYSHVEGYYNTSTTAGNYSSVGGQRNIASGNTTFIHSSGSTVMGNYSSILGGKGNIINPDVTGSTILGGSYITGTTNNTVYGVNFNASGSIFSGGTNLLNIFALAGSDTNTYVTGGTFNNNLLTLTRNDNVQVNTLINNFSGITVNGDVISNNTTRISQSNITGATTVDTINTGTTDGVVWHYTVKTSSDLRAGTVTAGWIGSSVVYNESSTTDIGNTDAITISVIESGGNILFVVTPSSGNWTVKLNRLLI